MNNPQDPSEQNDNPVDAFLRDDELSKLLQYKVPLAGDDFVSNTVNKIVKTEHKRRIILLLFGLLGLVCFCFLIEPPTVFHFTHIIGTAVRENLSFIMTGLFSSMALWIVSKETDFI